MKKYLGKEYVVSEFERKFSHCTPYNMEHKIRFFYNVNNKNDYFMYNPSGKYIANPAIQSIITSVISDIENTNSNGTITMVTDLSEEQEKKFWIRYGFDPQRDLNGKVEKYAFFWLPEQIKIGFSDINNTANFKSFVPTYVEEQWMYAWIKDCEFDNPVKEKRYEIFLLREQCPAFLKYIRDTVTNRRIPKLPYNIWKAIAQATGPIKFEIVDSDEPGIILETTGKKTKIDKAWVELLKKYPASKAIEKSMRDVASSAHSAAQSISNLGAVCKEYECNWNKEREENNMFNFDFGVYKASNIKFSPYGLAVYNPGAHKYVAYDKKEKGVIDVDILNFSADNMMYKVPVAISKVAEGDIILHSGVPMIVTKVFEKTENKIKAIDPAAAEEKTILPIKSPFKFDFVTKIVSVIDFGNADASVDSPFGNLLPFLMMGDNKNLDPMVTAMMLSGGNFDFDFNANPFMWLMFAGDKGKTDTSSLLPMMMFMNQNKTVKESK